LASRRIYFRVATLLRANHDPIDLNEYLHSGIAFRLRGEVIESVNLLDSALAYMTAMASLHAHPNADVENGSEQTNQMYYDALSRLSYMTGGKTGKDILDEERMCAIERYLERKKRLIKNR